MKLKHRLLIFLLAVVLAIPMGARPQDPVSGPPDAGTISIETVIDRAIERERTLSKTMTTLRPLIETYTQTMEPHADLGAVPKADKYFLGKLDFTRQGAEQKSLLPESSSFFGSMAQTIKGLYSITLVPEGFAGMVLLGPNFEKARYTFEYVRREFLGEVRTLVFDVQPKTTSDSQVAFIGRIWVEDRDFNIVRFNGTRTPSSGSKLYFHFDSWREEIGRAGQWLPTYVYTEESDLGYFMGMRKLRFKGQTRLWGYNIGGPNSRQNELTTLTVEADNVRDTAEDAEIITPVEAFRSWERQAEDNVIHRLETAGLVAPEGPVNQVLETVVNNLQITNNLDIQPPVRARVLLTTPVESFTVGHTIVLSRGFIDVLPDEASLALALAHELGHIALGHALDTKYAFSDRTLFQDEEALMRFTLHRNPAQEKAADTAAVGYLKNSPYKDKLSNAGLFLRALEERSSKLTHLLRPHMGNQLAKDGKAMRMAGLIPQAPTLQMERTDQIAALPLGSRIQVDQWSNNIKLLKAKSVSLLSAREKMPFEVTPVYLYLTRLQRPSQAASAQTGQ